MRRLNPSLLFESLPRAQKMLALELLFLPRTPSLNGADRDLGMDLTSRALSIETPGLPWLAGSVSLSHA
jgi:hypothetical protein